MKPLTKKIKLTSFLKLPYIILVLVLIMAILDPVFLTWNNFMSILLAICIYGIMMCGTIFPLLTGGMDLSIASNAALAGCIAIVIASKGGTTGAAVVGILVGLGVGALCGAINGLVSFVFRIPAFIVTLATSNILNGLAQTVTNQKTINLLDNKLINWIGTGKILGIPFPIIFFLAIVALAWWVLKYTRFGRYVYATGGNPTATRYSGIDTRKIQISAFLISGTTAAMAGIILSCFNRLAVYTQGTGYDGNVLVALLVGGVSLAGGEGRISGALLGLLIIGIMNNAMILLGIDSIYQDLVKGLLVILAVAVDAYARNKDSGLKRKTLRDIFARG